MSTATPVYLSVAFILSLKYYTKKETDGERGEGEKKKGREEKAALDSHPLFFVRSGIVYPDNTTNKRLSDSGSGGYFWSRNGNTGGNAFFLAFNSVNVLPSNNYNRYLGFSLRCLHP